MIRQVPPQERWPSGDSIHFAAFPYSAAALSERFGLQFIDDCDDLGSYKLAAIALPNAGQVWLEYREDAPSTETLVLADSEQDLATALSEFLEAFGLREEELDWISPLVFLGRGSIGQQELIKAVAHELHRPEQEVSKVVSAMFDEIKSSLAKGEEVSIPEFGTFGVDRRPQGVGRNRRIVNRRVQRSKRYPSFKPTSKSKVAS